jgi:anaphase-promoting complex subunit 2
LVSIYETREVIITELQILLAQRLLAVKDYDAVKEVSLSRSITDDRSAS